MSKSDKKQKKSKGKKRGDASDSEEEKAPVATTWQCPQLVSAYKKWILLTTVILPILFAVAYITIPTLLSLNALVNLVSPILAPATTPRSQQLTSHFLSALSEISTTIPRFEELALAPDRHSQYTMRRRQIDMINSLSYTTSKLSGTSEASNEMARHVTELKELMYGIHQRTADSEDAFKDAVAHIDTTTAYILKQLPLLNLALQDGHICQSLEQLGQIIESVGALIKQLDTSTVPVTAMRIDVTKLVSNIGLLETQLQHAQNKASVGLVAHDRQSEEYRQASWFTRMTKPDQQAYESLVLLHRSLDDMQRATRFLDTTFEKTETQIQVALAHLRSTNRRLSDIYVEMSRSSDQIDGYKRKLTEMHGEEGSQYDVCQEQVRFDAAQIERLRTTGEETVRKITAIRTQNDPILSAIGVYGYGAIGDCKTSE